MDDSGLGRFLGIVVAFLTIITSLIVIYEFFTGNQHLVINFGNSSPTPPTISTPAITPSVNGTATVVVTPPPSTPTSPTPFNISATPWIWPIWLVTGLIVGCLASLIIRGGGCLSDTIAGIVGSFLGGSLTNLLFSTSGILVNIAAACIGAWIVLFIFRVIAVYRN